MRLGSVTPSTLARLASACTLAATPAAAQAPPTAANCTAQLRPVPRRRPEPRAGPRGPSQHEPGARAGRDGERQHGHDGHRPHGRRAPRDRGIPDRQGFRHRVQHGAVTSSHVPGPAGRVHARDRSDVERMGPGHEQRALPSPGRARGGRRAEAEAQMGLRLSRRPPVVLRAADRDGRAPVRRELGRQGLFARRGQGLHPLGVRCGHRRAVRDQPRAGQDARRPHVGRVLRRRRRQRVRGERIHGRAVVAHPCGRLPRGARDRFAHRARRPAATCPWRRARRGRPRCRPTSAASSADRWSHSTPPPARRRGRRPWWTNRSPPRRTRRARRTGDRRARRSGPRRRSTPPATRCTSRPATTTATPGRPTATRSSRWI